VKSRRREKIGGSLSAKKFSEIEERGKGRGTDVALSQEDLLSSKGNRKKNQESGSPGESKKKG